MGRITVIVDDIDGTEGASPVTFAYEGTTYAIDLSAANRAKLEDALEPFKEKAKEVTSPLTAKPSKKAAPGRDLKAIREWAEANGHTVSPRGRIAASVIEAYDKAH